MLKASAQGTATRERILEAAFETVRREGYANTSARAIARRGSFNQALIFSHFGEVNQLLLAAVDRVGDVLRKLYREGRGSPACTLRSSPLCGPPARPWWASGSAVFPPLFHSRVNLTPTSSGQDYGRFDSAAFNAKIDATAQVPDASAREKAWGELDQELSAQVAAIALTNQKSVFVHGAGVRNYVDNQALGGTVDLATVAVQ